MLNLKDIYTNMPNQTKRILYMNVQASGDTSNGELGGGVWFVELNKVDNRYGYAVATSYSGAGKVRLHRQEIFDSEWKGWKDESRDAFAPAGYGLGENAPKRIGSLDEVDGAGWYSIWFNAEDMPAGALHGNWTFQVTHYGEPSHFAIRMPANHNWDDYSVLSELTRWKQNGVWQPWEWEHPPMQLGVEYRTTERYLGKPVYCKVISFGALPNNTSKSVAHGISGKDINVRYDITTTASNRMMANYPNIVDVIANATEVYIQTNTDISNIDVNFVLWYTKN